jgi:hypothetical protein
MSSPTTKILIVINSNNGSISKSVNTNLADLETKLSAINCQIVSFQVSSLIDTFNYKGGVYPLVIGNVYWLPFMFLTYTDVYADIENDIDRRNDLNIMNGKFNGSVYMKLNQYLGSSDIQQQYIDPTNNDAIVNWVNGIN